MSQSDKAAFYAALKNSGVTFDKHYREYSTEELAEAYRNLPEDRRAPLPEEELPSSPQAEDPQPAGPPLMERPLDALPGAHVLSVAEGEPIRVDEQGLIWYQEEITKPAFPKPRGRRVLKYNDTGVERKEIVSGQYLESFEVAGNRTKVGEVKITLPSYQVGIYKDPNMPFKIHVYNGQRGFNLFEVEEFYGGADMVPPGVQRVYVQNVLCYDIRTVVRAIQNEYRQRQLQGGI